MLVVTWPRILAGLVFCALLLITACGTDSAPGGNAAAEVAPLGLRRIDQASSYRYRMELLLNTQPVEPTDAQSDETPADEWQFVLLSEGEVLVPDREQGRVKLTTPFLAFDREVLRIGDEYWNRPAPGAPWEPGRGASSTLGYLEFGVSPSALFGTDESGAAAEMNAATYFGKLLLTKPGTPDTLEDGRTGLRYKLNSEQMGPVYDMIRGPFAGIRGDFSDAIVWVDEESRLPLRWEISMSGGTPPLEVEMIITFFDYDATDIVLLPPEAVATAQAAD